MGVEEGQSRKDNKGQEETLGVMGMFWSNWYVNYLNGGSDFTDK